MEPLEEGSYTAKLEDYCLTETKKGKPQVELLFSFNDGKANRSLRKFCSFQGDAKKWTMETLILVGMKTWEPEKLIEGKESGVLAVGEEFNIVVQEETKQDGKTQMGIRFVNKLGGFGKVFDKAKVKGALASLKGEFMMTKKGSGQDRAIPNHAPGANGGPPPSHAEEPWPEDM